ncbi:homocysteine biosynthesis protein [Eubacteriaceae bacterium ES3]|nr:homocysteine biosynthesis protein [Eubacteriaceae bacterium ES3]
MAKTYAQINEKIKNGDAVVVTAEEVIDIVKERGIKEAADYVDVVTTATFGPMCSSGAFLNFGHSDPAIRMSEIMINNVEAYGGLAAVDTYLGATQPSCDQGIEYGGAHVIEDLIARKSVHLVAKSAGTDCYPRTEIDTWVDLDDLNEAYLYNPRNVYQNYNAAINTSAKRIYTYMGILKPNMGNITYSTSGQLSPLLNDPLLRTIGMGTRIFFGGAQGFVSWMGTQFNTACARDENGFPQTPGATLALIGNMKEMDPRYIRGAAYEKYGTSMFVGVGIPIPILDEEMMKFVSVTNKELTTNIIDYSVQSKSKPVIKRVSYEELRSGSVDVSGKKIKTSPMSSLKRAREIADELKGWIVNQQFYLQEPIMQFPMANTVNGLEIRKAEK